MVENVTKYPDHFEKWILDDPPYTIPYGFEQRFDFNEWRLWGENNLNNALVICAIYFVFVFAGPMWMKNRKAYSLQKPLALWNFLLAIFSIMGFIRVAPEMFDLLKKEDGLHKSLCVREGAGPASAFWCFAFAASKFAEFGDTIFIVLRKKPLIFLHWFHHITMAYCTMYSYSTAEPMSRWLVLINYFVHSFMYTYYTLTALRFKIPKRISMMVTTIQIIQFASALFLLNAYTIWDIANGGNCVRTPLSIKLQMSIGSVYLFLFSKLFYYSYIANPKAKLS